MKCMAIHAKNPIRPPNKKPVTAIAIIRDDRVLTLTRDPMPSPMSVQPRPARKARLTASGSFSGDTAEWVGEDSSEKRRTTLAAMTARPVITGMIERSLDTATKDN
jgi:hypothetical protein